MPSKEASVACRTIHEQDLSDVISSYSWNRPVQNEILRSVRSTTFGLPEETNPLDLVNGIVENESDGPSRSRTTEQQHDRCTKIRICEVTPFCWHAFFARHIWFAFSNILKLTSKVDRWLCVRSSWTVVEGYLEIAQPCKTPTAIYETKKQQCQPYRFKRYFLLLTVSANDMRGGAWS